MESMILLNEVANLGDAIDDFAEELDSPTKENRASEPTRSSSSRDSSLLNDKVYTTTLLSGKASSGDSANAGFLSKRDVPNDDDNVAKENEMKDEAAVPTLEAVNEGEKDWVGDTQEDSLGEEPPAMDIDEGSSQIGILQHTSATTQVKDHLDDWKEPVNKQDKIPDPTIQDILMFRKAMQFLDDMQPFGASFGPAFTRDLCIESSKSLYKRLLSLSPGAIVLPFDVICVLAHNMDGSLDDKKAKSLVTLFRPDRYNKVSFLNFVQSCDSVYKNLRYLRASHGNSILIDGVLESIFNSVFYFFLGLSVLSILHLNPWALLVSLSTILVSFAFAMGPSAAKMVEGMILIAIRRPFDLGDMISIVQNTSAPDSSEDPGYHNTWIVEDVTLFTTTLRFSRTNEVSTVNNGSIANSRIVNHGRSRNALVNVSLPMRIGANSDEIQIVQSALEQHIQDMRVWTSLVSFRITQIDPANDLIVYSARIQHFKSWQDLTGVLQARGDLQKFCTEILIKLDIQYGGPIAKSNVFVKEFPENSENLPSAKV